MAGLEIVIIIFMLVPALIWIPLIILAVWKYKQYKRMVEEPARKIVAIEPGYVELSGTLYPFPGRTYISPISKTPCIMFRTRVYTVETHRDSRGHSHSREVTLWSMSEGGTVILSDDSGSMALDLRDCPDAMVQVVKESQNMMRDPSPAVQSFCSEHNIGMTGPFGILKRDLRFEERVLTEGQYCYVVGEAEGSPFDTPQVPGLNMSQFTLKRNSSFHLSKQGERALERGQRTAAVVLFVLSVLGIIGHVIWAMFLMSMLSG